MKNKKILIILIAALLLASCKGADVGLEPIVQVTATLTATPQNTTEPTDTPALTSSPTPQPTQPKYIFIVIGDGLGRGAMTLGEIYSRLENEDMSKGAPWEEFAYQSYVRAMGESASGGTAIASGVETEPWHIGKDVDGNELYTIMDRAKEAGMGTGVISNSFLTDATPATFMSHVTNRYAWTRIAQDFPQSNVDYIAGGGLNQILSETTSGFKGGEDCILLTPDLEGPEEVIPTLIDMGYETNFGLEGAISVLERMESGSFIPEKSISIFTGGQMPFDYHKYRSSDSSKYNNVPTLLQMTEAGIQSLSQNDNGFVMMIEAALIDKCGHKQSQEMMTYQVTSLNRVLEYLMDFYKKYPDETLIILTADHETGNYSYDDELLDQWKASSNFVWMDDGYEMAKYVNEQWGLLSYDENLNDKINYAKLDAWDTIEDNRALLYTAVTMDVCQIYGTQIRTQDHSGQLVPLFVVGKGSEAFDGSTHIKEVPITICEIMGWEALPEILQDGN